jgi:hypothetical protein
MRSRRLDEIVCSCERGTVEVGEELRGGGDLSGGNW